MITLSKGFIILFIIDFVIMIIALGYVNKKADALKEMSKAITTSIMSIINYYNSSCQAINSQGDTLISVINLLVNHKLISIEEVQAICNSLPDRKDIKEEIKDIKEEIKESKKVD